MSRNSRLFRINGFDFVKGLFVAVASAVLTTIYSVLEQGSFPSDWNTIGLVATTSTVSYLLKQFVTTSDNKLLSKESHSTKRYTNGN